MNRIPAIDLFAGPGGLGEGFSSAGFDVRLSIEMDPYAHSTLELRSMIRFLRNAGQSGRVTDILSTSEAEKGIRDLFHQSTGSNSTHAWRATLGETAHMDVANRIDHALDNSEDWILLGGPPCQAYSLAGRSRMRTTRSDFDSDHRHFLYREYLRIVADLAPPLFLMENVKGLLSAKVAGMPMFEQILLDLERPRESIDCHPRRLVFADLEYELRPIVLPESMRFDGPYGPKDFIVCAEKHGIPQARHRVLVLGVRKPAPEIGWLNSIARRAVPVRHAIDDLPRLLVGVSRRSTLSRSEVFALIPEQNWLAELRRRDPEVALRIIEVAAFKTRNQRSPSKSYRSRRIRQTSNDLFTWLLQNQPRNPLNHEARSHIPEDIHRYLFCACHAEAHGKAPKLEDFPLDLLPHHKNIKRDGAKSIFADRFRVQTWDSPSTTVTSHISKDGHYYIHPDPFQCRSLSVREAARLQTFPDDYLFCGPRTEQYKQVGNAVPPYLAFQIAKLLKPAFEKSSLHKKFRHADSAVLDL